MGGSFLQLAALGSQDVYLSGNPEVTLFKSVYKRYTHFSMETEQVNFDGVNLELNNSNMLVHIFEANPEMIKIIKKNIK